jgi:hypothetical protein
MLTFAYRGSVARPVRVRYNGGFLRSVASHITWTRLRTSFATTLTRMCALKPG